MTSLDKFELLRACVPNVSRETFEVLLTYEQLLLNKNQEVNLVGRGTLGDVWSRHFLDAAQLFSLISDPSKSLMDIGSGGGFPGMVLAILGCSNVTLVDSTKKKCDFLEFVSRETNVKAGVCWSRVESIVQRYDYVTARAVADLSVMLGYAFQVMKPRGTAFFMKGRRVQEEIKEAQKKWVFTYELKQSITHTDGYICQIKNIHKK